MVTEVSKSYKNEAHRMFWLKHNESNDNWTKEFKSQKYTVTYIKHEHILLNILNIKH